MQIAVRWHATMLPREKRETFGYLESHGIGTHTHIHIDHKRLKKWGTRDGPFGKVLDVEA